MDHGHGILVVEDEALIGFDLADLLADAGYTVCGPFAKVCDAMEAVRVSPIALAILDVHLGEGETSGSIAEALSRDGTPFMFVSGYSEAGSEVLRQFPDARRVSKPWDPDELLALVAQY
ncbi:response regulator [Acuticoccus mangrovi]|uniref:Response regulator n=1 Tax=Acuticoccus mangrovi TaxID=2796142 RepID=A0A934MI77_9HYPH|nr:response regulator [Acuticoccus mangrovi]MBJ3776891.1 response regulator [Acuticoccus mangrovi]